jgi:2'-5' RNA ligase
VRDPRGAKELLRVLGAGPAFGEVRVEVLHLMRSELGPRGARYSTLTAAPLGGPLGQG